MKTPYSLLAVAPRSASKAIFPIGERLKPEVRKLAADAKLPNAERKDSQGICFIGNVKMQDFLSTYVQDAPGNIVDLHGRKLGTHRGVHQTRARP